MPPTKAEAPTKKVTMKTTPRPRRVAPQSLLPSGGPSVKLVKHGTVSKDARVRAPAVRKPATTTTRRASTTPTTPRRRFQPPPPPPMYWICYDFTIKLVRGLFLGIFIGLILTVALPWIIDRGFDTYDAITEAKFSWPDMSSYTNLSSWNVTSPRIWRPDQESQQKNFWPTEDPKVLADQRLFQNFPRFNRTLTVVHVGHTGGRPLMEACPNLQCQEKYANEPAKLQPCLSQNIPSTPLARAAKHYFHLGTGRPNDPQQSTSFLFTLRNPVDRVLAIYAGAHPLACPDPAKPPPRPWGCTTREYWNLPDTDQYNFFTRCFPNQSPESFGQAVKSPWKNITGEEKVVTTWEGQKSDCRWMARELASGKGLTDLAPHMRYNYNYYGLQSLFKFDRLEVLVLRAESEAEDLALLQRLMGGSDPPDPTTTVPTTAGMTTPTVTPQAYQKLCCVLEDDIQMYDIILQRASNLPSYAKEESMNLLRDKCGLTPTMGWDDWRVQCKNQMEIDSVLLTP